MKMSWEGGGKKGGRWHLGKARDFSGKANIEG